MFSHCGPLPGLSAALCRTDLGLARLVDTAREELTPWFEAHAGALCMHTFASVALWMPVFDIWWKTVGSHLLLIARGEGDGFLMVPPMGRGDATQAAHEGLELVRALNPGGASPRIQEVDDAMAASLQAAGWRVRECAYEYRYDRAALARLSGRALEKKRQMCNRFERDYDWRWTPFEPEHFPAALALYRRWLGNRAAAHPDLFHTAQAEASFRCVHKALRDPEDAGRHCPHAVGRRPAGRIHDGSAAPR